MQTPRIEHLSFMQRLRLSHRILSSKRDRCYFAACITESVINQASRMITTFLDYHHGKFGSDVFYDLGDLDIETEYMVSAQGIGSLSKRLDSSTAPYPMVGSTLSTGVQEHTLGPFDRKNTLPMEYVPASRDLQQFKQSLRKGEQYLLSAPFTSKKKTTVDEDKYLFDLIQRIQDFRLHRQRLGRSKKRCQQLKDGTRAISCIMSALEDSQTRC